MAVALPASMNAWTMDRYGPIEALRLRALPMPRFRDEHEVLIRVVATSVNPADRHALHPPIFLRRGRGLLRPKDARPGLDVAGRVERVGREVTDLKIGDEVFGVARGAFGEYAVADASQVVGKPSRLSFPQAAALPIAATTAFQGLHDRAHVRPGQRVLVNGASGGVGTFGVQIAKALGAEVHAVCSPGNVEPNRALGASRVFDYAREDFAESGERYDVVFDTQLNHSLRAYRAILRPGGLLLIVGAGPGSPGRLIFRLLSTVLGARVVGPRARFFVASVRREPLEQLRSLVEAGRLTPVIDRTYPFSQLPDALRYLAEGHARGKIVVQM
ncbi:MAG TPA: NAD(P)-dependent alcohol dehydrogenase [Thermoplasmata archaeon]|nr:NAD(P)-dependent alcohol dehydrogenase [Thermoplasmata archaeon]